MENCNLCSVKVEYFEYNLNTTKARLSGSSLISLIEYATGENFGININLNICKQCFELFNELDAIKLRLTEISNKLKKYIEMRSVSINFEEKFETHFDEITQYCVPEIKKPKIEIIFKDTESVNSSSQLKETRLKNDNDLKNHMDSHIPLHICEMCGRSYKYKQNFKQHLKVHAGISSFPCTDCQRKFTRKSDLMRHIPIHTGEKPHQCEICGKRFLHHTSFSIHIKSHIGEKSHKCSLCDETFTTTSHLKRHIRMHTGEKNFACSRCGKRFAERYNLVAHEKRHNLKKTKKNKFSYSKQTLEDHKAKMHNSDINKLEMEYEKTNEEEERLIN